jgi:hypothetical protein
MDFRFTLRLTLLATLCVAVTGMANPRGVPEATQKRANEEANAFKLSSTVSAKPIEKAIAPPQVPDDESHGLGALPLTAERLAEDKKLGREVRKIRLNKIGLARVNVERAKEGQRALVAGVDLQVALIGMEVETEADAGGSGMAAPAESGTNSVEGGATSEFAAGGESGGALLAVNNSTLKYFPPIRDQGSVNSCVAWCEIYYNMTHETALMYDRDVKAIGDDAIFSPLFTYNFLNGGINDGTYFGDHYTIAKMHGAVRWTEMTPTSSFARNWDTSSAHYRRAIDSRIDGYGYISSLNTSNGLALLKTHLANGRIASYRTEINDWGYKTVSNDPNTTGDDSQVGKQIAYTFGTTANSGHGMTVVGYNDEIWCDINGNSVIDANEKGALLVANSDGTTWKNGGYCWVAYNVLQTRDIFSSYRVYIASIKPVQYAPSVVARITLNHNNRSQVYATVGIGRTSRTTPETSLTPEILYCQGGAYAFSGASPASQDFTYYLDMTELAPTIGTAKRWFVTIYDSGLNDGNLTLKAFDLYYTASGSDRPVGSCSTLPVVANGGYQDAWVEWTMGDVLPAVTVATAVTNAAETSQTPGSWTITRDGSTAASLAVHYSLSGTATQGVDYTISPASPVTIPAGQASATVTLTPVDDVVADEGTESAILTIQPNAAYYVAAATATVTIADNDLIAPVVSNQGWTAIGPTSADLSGVVVSGAQASVWICWGAVDAGMASTGSWGKVEYVGNFAKGVPFTAHVTGMGTNTTYWYRFYLVNAAGTGWSAAATAFSGIAVNLGGGWTPAEITPTAWYDASTATINAGTVSVVNAGSSGSAIKGPASLAANGIGTLQAVQFNGTSQYVTGSTTNTGAALTAFLVGKSLNTSQTAYAGMMSIWVTGQPNDWNNVGSAVLFGQNNTTVNSVYTHRISSLSSSTGGLTNGFLAGTVFNGSTDTFYLNGTASAAVASTGSFNSDKVILGGRWQGTSPFWNGRFGEAIICKTNLSTSDRQKLEGYLAHKWGLAGSLPTNHVYRYLPPGGAGAGVSVANRAPASISNSTATLNGFVSALSTNVDIYVHWGLSDGGTNAGLWISAEKAGSYTNASTNLSYAATGLNPGQTYYYTFSASDAVTNVWASPSWTFRTSGQTSILAPSHLSATPGSGQINLTWTDNSTNETGFRVERSMSGMSGFAKVGSAPANATNYTDSAVSPGPIYYYRVAATNAAESSVVSGTASAGLPKLPATVTIGSTNQMYTGTSRAVSTVTDPAGLSVDVTYNGSLSEPVNAGSYTVVATINDTTYEGSTNGTLVVVKATPVVASWPSASSIMEGQSLFYSELSGGSASVPGSFGFDNPSSAPPRGTNQVDVAFEADDAVNYFPVGGTVDVVVAEYHLDPPLLNHQGWTTNGTTGANLSSMLVAGDSASIWVCWGASDGGKAGTGTWDHVAAVGSFVEGEPFTAHVTGLATNTTYWYRFVGTNAAGTGWTDTAVAFNGSPVGTDEPWTPVEMATAAWYDASDANTLWADTTGLTNATTKVARWDDKSGNNRHVAQSNSTQQPSYASSVITFDGTTNVLFNNSPFAYAMGSADVYVVAAVNTNTGKRLVAESSSTNFNPLYNPAQTHGPVVGSAMAAYVRHDVGGSQSETFMATNPPLSAAGAFNINTNNLYHWRDAATNFTGRVAGGSPTTVSYRRSGTVTVDRFAIGAIGPRPSSLNGSVFVNAGIREIVITGILSDTDRQKMEGYLAHKWTLAGNLPSDHPYKYQPPSGAGGVTVANLAPAAISGSAATLNASVSTLSTNVDVYVHWGLSDGGTNAGAWTNSAKVGSYTNTSATVSYPAEGLNPGQTYCYTFSVSNASAHVWALPSWTFRTPGAVASCLLTVSSDHGSPSPSGATSHGAGSSIDVALSGSPVINADTQYVCTGWAATGSGLTSGTGTNLSFTITNDTTITWQWTTNYWIDFSVIGN